MIAGEHGALVLSPSAQVRVTVYPYPAGPSREPTYAGLQMKTFLVFVGDSAWTSCEFTTQRVTGKRE